MFFSCNILKERKLPLLSAIKKKKKSCIIKLNRTGNSCLKMLFFCNIPKERKYRFHQQCKKNIKCLEKKNLREAVQK